MMSVYRDVTENKIWTILGNLFVMIPIDLYEYCFIHLLSLKTLLPEWDSQNIHLHSSINIIE